MFSSVLRNWDYGTDSSTVLFKEKKMSRDAVKENLYLGGLRGTGMQIFSPKGKE